MTHAFVPSGVHDDSFDAVVLAIATDPSGEWCICMIEFTFEGGSSGHEQI